ncbi:MAG: hypothetical protein QOG30_2144 [Acidimicrobiaceae bacterium]
MGMARIEGASRSSAFPRTAERLVPWLGGAMLIAGVQVVVELTGGQPTLPQRVGMILGLCGSLAVAGVVAARSSREAESADREERGRPALYEVSGPEEAGPLAYIESMKRWAEAMLELTEHASATPAAIDADVADELSSACEDTRALRDLLGANVNTPLKVTGMATLRSICSMWESEQGRIEQLAARMDPEWHRRWQARSVVERLLRRGVRQPEATALPYRS